MILNSKHLTGWRLRKNCLLGLVLVFLLNVLLAAVGACPGEAAEIAAPTKLYANPVSSSQINLTWNDNSNNETGFKIERKTGSNNYVQVGMVEANTATFSDTGRSNNVTYTYRVRAYNHEGYSNYSNEVSVTTVALPAAPSGLTAKVASSSRISITWKDNSNNETGFKIERKTAGGSYTQIATVGVNATSYISTGLSNNTRYYYRVRAYNTAGNSNYSNETSAVTGTVPAAPADLAATTVSSSKIKLTWDDNSNNEEGFKIERRTSGGSYRQIATTGSNSTSYTDSGLSNNTRYYYRVRAYNDTGASGYSSEAGARTEDLLSAPSDFEAEPLSWSKIRLTWDDDSNNETGFKIERRTAGGSYKQIASVGSNTTSYTDTGLSSNTGYYYRIKAYNSSGYSDYSSEEKATTDKLEQTVIKLVIGKTTYYVNDKSKTMDTAPLIRENRTLLPIRYVAEAIGASVGWNQSDEKVTVTMKGTVIELWIGQNYARVNGEYRLIDIQNPGVAPFVIPPGRTMLPLRFISENLGCKVEWDSRKQEVTVTYPAS